MKKSFSDILSSLETGQKRRLAAKIPSWAGVDGIEIPSALSLEQCSSEAAALYKASLLERLGVSGAQRSLADLNCGLGVDAWAFALKAGKVYCNEMNPQLAASDERNFARLGIRNVEFSCSDAALRLESLPQVDMIYLDPARRNGIGRKVFLLEDCSPNVLEMLDALWEKTSLAMLKLSPMADIAMLARRLDGLCEVHIVGIGGECKELLCILKRGWAGPFRTFVVELAGGIHTEPAESGRGETSEGGRAELGEGELRIAGHLPVAGDILLEPSAQILKYGKFGAVCSIFNLAQLDRFTHLYVLSGDTVGDGAEGAGLDAFFKKYRVLETAALSKTAMKSLGEKYPQADVTARNLPLTSEELKRKMGIAGSGGAHIFGAGVLGERVLIVCEKMALPESVV